MDIGNFSLIVQPDISLVNLTTVTRGSWLSSGVKKINYFRSFMVLNKTSDVSSWLVISNTCKVIIIYLMHRNTNCKGQRSQIKILGCVVRNAVKHNCVCSSNLRVGFHPICSGFLVVPEMVQQEFGIFIDQFGSTFWLMSANDFQSMYCGI